MPNILILTDRKDLKTAIIRGEPLPYGISFSTEMGEDWKAAEGEVIISLRVNLRAISGTAFALWILRKLRSIPGDHRLEIVGQLVPLQMPRAIDLIADRVSGTGDKADEPVAA